MRKNSEEIYKDLANILKSSAGMDESDVGAGNIVETGFNNDGKATTSDITPPPPTDTTEIYKIKVALDQIGNSQRERAESNAIKYVNSLAINSYSHVLTEKMLQDMKHYVVCILDRDQVHADQYLELIKKELYNKIGE